MLELPRLFLDGRPVVRTTIAVALAAVVLLPVAPASAAPTAVRLLGPPAGTAVGETVALRATATPGVTAVRFQGRWTDADGIRRWHTIGTDRVAGDGFSMAWATAALKEQRAVYVRAVTLTRGGKAGARSAAVRLGAAAAPAATPAVEATGGVAGQSAAAVRHTVKGTCASTRECRANARSGPGTTYARTGQLAEGERVDVVCQGNGETVVTLAGVSSVWNRLLDGSWVSDLYLDTAGKPGFSPAIPRC